MTVFDYSNKILTVVLTVFSGTNIFSYVKNKQLLGLITSVITSLITFLYYSLYLLEGTRNKVKEKKHNKLLCLAKNKLDCIEMLITNSIKDGIISHDEFLEILKEKKMIL